MPILPNQSVDSMAVQLLGSPYGIDRKTGERLWGMVETANRLVIFSGSTIADARQEARYVHDDIGQQVAAIDPAGIDEPAGEAAREDARALHREMSDLQDGLFAQLAAEPDTGSIKSMEAKVEGALGQAGELVRAHALQLNQRLPRQESPQRPRVPYLPERGGLSKRQPGVGIA